MLEVEGLLRLALTLAVFPVGILTGIIGYLYKGLVQDVRKLEQQVSMLEERSAAAEAHGVRTIDKLKELDNKLDLIIKELLRGAN